MKGKRGDFKWDEFAPWIPYIIIFCIVLAGIALLVAGKLDPAIAFLKGLFHGKGGGGIA